MLYRLCTNIIVLMSTWEVRFIVPSKHKFKRALAKVLHVTDTSQNADTLEEKKCGGIEVPVTSDNLYTFSFADDQALGTQDEEVLKFMIRKLEEEYHKKEEKKGIKINLDKTEYLTTTEEETIDVEMED